MRAIITMAGALLALGACNRGPVAENAVVSDEDLTSVAASSNDMTAIDAATGDDANMAADTNMALAPFEPGDNAASPAPATKPSKAPPSPPAPADDNTATDNLVQ